VKAIFDRRTRLQLHQCKIAETRVIGGSARPLPEVAARLRQLWAVLQPGDDNRQSMYGVA
jgi:hypothetical protein